MLRCRIKEVSLYVCTYVPVSVLERGCVIYVRTCVGMYVQ